MAVYLSLVVSFSISSCSGTSSFLSMRLNSCERQKKKEQALPHDTLQPLLATCRISQISGILYLNKKDEVFE